MAPHLLFNEYDNGLREILDCNWRNVSTRLWAPQLLRPPRSWASSYFSYTLRSIHLVPVTPDRTCKRVLYCSVSPHTKD
jgi:hypothetical protein